jgi:hypothetical protein
MSAAPFRPEAGTGRAEGATAGSGSHGVSRARGRELGIMVRWPPGLNRSVG